MNTKHSKKGFTLLETLVAISILLIAVVGPMSIIGRSLPQSAYARDHAIAVNLAQEGIEAVRQKRDSNMLDKWNSGPSSWDSGLGNGTYVIDPTSSTMLFFCGAIGCDPNTQAIRQNAAGWFYQSNTGVDPMIKFIRFISINDGSGPHEKRVTAFVFWQDSSETPYSLVVTEYISGINSL